MNPKIRLPLVLLFLILLFFVPVMVRTVLSADPTPTPEAEEIPVPTPIGIEREILQSQSLKSTSSFASPPPVYGEINISQDTDPNYHPQVAFNETEQVYLVIWIDNEAEGLTNIYGRYVTMDGEVLDPSFLIAEDRPGPVQLKVISGTNIFAVVWREGDLHSGKLYMNVVEANNPASPVKFNVPLLIHHSIDEQYNIAFNKEENEFLVIWFDQRHPGLDIYRRGEIYGRRISPNATFVGSEFNFTQVSSDPSTTEILQAPIETGELGLAHNPTRNVYMLTYSIYFGTDFGEDIKSQIFMADLSQAFSPYGITDFVPGIQWQSRVVYHEELEEFLIIWSDNRSDEIFWDIYGQRISGQTFTTVGLNIPIITGTESQRFPEIIALPSVSPLPSYALTYQLESSENAEVCYLIENGNPLGLPLVLSYADFHTRKYPDITIGHGIPVNVMVVWQDAFLNLESEIHGHFIPSDEFQGAQLLSPINYTMVLSLKPTFRWGSVSGADTYEIRLGKFADYQNGENIHTYYVNAAVTRDLENPDIHTYKIPDALSFGKTIQEAGYIWRVRAFDSTGIPLGTSLLSVFQIPPLGIEPDFPYWNDYDDLIYLWSEERDLPPNLSKAVLASESENITERWGDELPSRSFLYEAKQDLLLCDANDPSKTTNVCQQAKVKPFLQPTTGIPDPRPANLAYSFLANRPNIAEWVGDTIASQATNWKSIAGYAGCSDLPSHGLYECLNNWFDEDPPYAQYRVMSGYGLMGVSYWDVYKYVDDPEDLYEPETNIILGTKILGDKRCWWSKASGSRYPYLDPESPDHIYLSSEDYTEADFIKWRQAISDYAGLGFHYTQGKSQKDQVERVWARFHGEDYDGNVFPKSYPVDVSGLSELGIEVQIQVEKGPQQVSRDKTYGATKEEDKWDDIDLPCPLPEFINQTSGEGNKSNLSLVPIHQTIKLQNSSGIVLEEQLVDFQGDGQPEWAVLVWEGDPDIHTVHQAEVQIYRDSTLQELLWQSPPIDGVTVNGYGFLDDHLIAGGQIFQVEFLVGNHGVRAYFVNWDGNNYSFFQFTDQTGFMSDHLVGTKGGAFLQSDGSIAVLNRGWQAFDQTEVITYRYTSDGYIEAESYVYDSTISDTTLPMTTVEIDPPPNPSGWNNSAIVSLSATDDQGVAFLDYSLSAASGDTRQRSYLSLVSFPLEEGIWNLRYNATDLYGNLEPENQFEFRVDQTPPVTNLMLIGYWEPGLEAYLSDVDIFAFAADGSLVDGSEGSGINRIEYSLDEGTTWQPYALPVKLTEVGTHTLWVRGVDQAGNLESPIINGFEILPHGISVDTTISLDRDEGEEISIDTSFTDIDLTATHSALIHWGDSTDNQELDVDEIEQRVKAEHVYLDNGIYDAFWLIRNNHAVFTLSTFQVTISNLPPMMVDAGPDQEAEPGQDVLFSGSFTDPGTLDTHTIQWEFGDGESAEDTLSPAHSYKSPEVYLVTLTVTDDDGGVGSDTLTVTVTDNNLAPLVGAITAAPDPLKVGATVLTGVSFSDPGLDSWTATWDWGDGTSSDGTIIDFAVSGAHAYAETGLYTISVTVRDDDGGTGSSSYESLVVFDPEGGFVTGGGWIQSPEGAYTLDPDLTGKADFNLNLKYKKKSNLPTGNNKFDFKEADLKFIATDYDWLVVTGDKAVFQGVGEVTGQADYGFLISVKDRDTDMFRIKIWELGSGTVIYDSQPGDQDDADPITALGGGSIVIHPK